jgi:GT2 family glycosyltransferase/glycosyltransferase involved in cell wall biosynthesis
MLTVTVDVIVPVYRGLEAVERCIESVLSFPQATVFELIVVDDASPEPDLVRWLREAGDRRRITLLHQPSRGGFSAAVNRGLALHPERDAVVLHGDVEVANDWLDRLAAHAGKGRDVGTVAPFASYGGVAGYPRTDRRNALPQGHTVASLDGLFRRANSGASIDVPLTRGPCLYVRREAIATVGAFDAGPLGIDYGAEQDFCLRASTAGFRHLLAADTYVAHQGAQSFGETEARDLAARSQGALARLFPRYARPRSEFERDDPARPYQRRVDLLRLAESPKPLLLFIAHAWGGGIRRHMTELAAMVAERCNVLMLEPAGGDIVKLSWPSENEGFVAYFPLPDALPALATLLRSARLARMHFHHVHGLPRAVLDLPAAVGVPYDCTLHDYYAICPQYHLVAEDGRYCGEPDAMGCAACLARRPGQWGMDIGTWRASFERLLRGAERVFAPSHDVMRRLGRYFPEIEVTVLPHPEGPIHQPPRVTRVATLGNLSPEKGLTVVAACARQARERELPLFFRVLGSTTEPVPLWPDAPLSIHGQYAEGDLPRLVAQERPDVIWFPAQVPETYSYTLSVALAAGIPVVASALGALPERLAGYPSATLVPWDASSEAWNDALLAAARVGRVETLRPVAPVAKVS